MRLYLTMPLRKSLANQQGVLPVPGSHAKLKMTVRGDVKNDTYSVGYSRRPAADDRPITERNVGRSFPDFKSCQHARLRRTSLASVTTDSSALIMAVVAERLTSRLPVE